MLSIVLCQLLVVVIIALTIAIASGQQLFYLLPESGLKELDVAWGVMMLTNRRFWLVKDEHKEKKIGKRVIPASSCISGKEQIRRIKQVKMDMYQKIRRPRSQVLFYYHHIE